MLAPSAHAAPQVTASIRPLQLIAAAITDGVSTPVAIWSQGQDPHHVALRPSERRLLGGADVVLWIGPALERPLEELVADLDARVLTVQELAGITLLDAGGQIDPHLWTDTGNARAIASALAAALVALDAGNAARYSENLALFRAQLDALDASLRARLAAGNPSDWAVYHHSLRYLANALRLPEPLALADSQNNAPGIRGALAVREQLAQKGIVCMLAEPGINADEVLTLIDLPNFHIVTADVMGQGAAAVDYVAFMQALATALADCMRGAR